MPKVDEIAKIAGVSPRTAASVLSGEVRTRRDARERAARVIRAARRVGYRPNTAARSMRTGRFNTVSLILPASSSYFVPEQVLAMSRALETQHIQLNITQLQNERIEHDPDLLPSVLRERSCDGFLVVWHWSIPRLAIDAVHQHDAPTIWVNARLASDCVYPDERDAARRLIGRVAEAGHRRVGWLQRENRIEGQHHFSSADRETGLADGAERFGVEPVVGVWPELAGLGEGDEQAEALAGAWAELLDRPQPPTVLVAIQEMDAFAALRVAAERGLSVPADLSLVMFASPGVEVAFRGISNMHVPHRKMGRRAAAELLHKIDQPEAERPPVALPHAWMPGRTLAPPGGR